jgi:hypothetical protein
MGIYVYRISAKRVMCSDGKPANVAVYAYKPYGDWRLNAKEEFRSGCHASAKLLENGKLTGRFVFGPEFTEDSAVYEFGGATFADSAIGVHIHPIEGVKTVRPIR